MQKSADPINIDGADDFSNSYPWFVVVSSDPLGSQLPRVMAILLPDDARKSQWRRALV